MRGTSAPGVPRPPAPMGPAGVGGLSSTTSSSAASPRRTLKDASASLRAPPRQDAKSSSEHMRARNDVGVAAENPASRHPCLVHLMRLLEAPSAVEVGECAGLHEWGTAAREWLSTEAFAAVSKATDPLAEKTEALIVRFVTLLTAHLHSRGLHIDSADSAGASRHMREQALTIEQLRVQLAEASEAHRKAMREADMSWRERLRFEVADAVASTRNASLLLNSKDAQEIKGANMVLQGRVTELQAELKQLQAEVDVLQHDNGEKAEAIETLRTAFTALRSVRDGVQEDATKDLLRATYSSDMQIVRLNEVIANQACVIGELNDELRRAAVNRHDQGQRIKLAHEELLASVQRDYDALVSRHAKLVEEHRDLLRAHTDATTRQSSILAAMARNSVALVERQYRPHVITVRGRGRGA